MKHNWRIFELVLAGIQLCCGFALWFIIYLTFNNYYLYLWNNPLMDHYALIEVALRRNLTLLIISIFSILSGFLLIKNKVKGWVMSIITWIMLTIVMIINSYRIIELYPDKLDFISRVVICIMALVFIAIVITLNNDQFRQKYKPTKTNWVLIVVSVIIITATKFI